MTRMLPLVLLWPVLLAGCVRYGFVQDPDGAPSPDAGLDLKVPDDQASRDLAADVPADLALAGLNSPCNPPPCAAGLVCTGTGPVDYCRPACGGDAGCPDAEACGRPVSKPAVPLACLSVNRAQLYEGCAVDPCEPGLICSKGDDKVCYMTCATDKDCAAGEICIQMGGVPFSLCHPTCASDQDCPSSLHCSGFGPFPGGHCTPTTPQSAGGACNGHAYCKVGLRCHGVAGWAYCYPTCSTGTCSSGQVCATNDQGAKLCFTACAPLDSPVKCNSKEVCYPNPELSIAYCLPAQGDPTTCTNLVPCVSGKICVQGNCLQVCDASHPCPTGKSCVALDYQGKQGPWKACN